MVAVPDMADPRTEALGLAALEASVSQPPALQCCCGNADCDFLRHNCSVLDSVEKDVHTAARLGKVRGCPSCLCLIRSLGARNSPRASRPMVCLICCMSWLVVQGPGIRPPSNAAQRRAVVSYNGLLGD